MKILGTSATLIESESSFDPLNGYTLTQRWKGSEGALLTLASQFSASGARATVSTSDGVSMLSAVFGGRASVGGSEGDTPQDRYSFTQETAEVSPFGFPAARSEALGYVSVAQYQKDIRDAVDAGEAYPLSTTTYPFGLAIYNHMSLGLEALETRRPVLKRTRTMSVLHSQRMSMNVSDNVWTTAALISAFALPQVVQDRLPTTPTAITGFQWGWKLRVDESDYIVGSNRIEEVKEWVFANWSSTFYTIISS